MDFFEHQDRARKQTRRLIALFVLGVVAVVACTTFAVWGAFELSGIAAAANDTTAPHADTITGLGRNANVLWGAAIGTMLLVLGGSLFRLMQLGGGNGSAIAERLGGRLLSHDHADPDARKLLNVVEEMSIAAGTPVPPVYLLEDESGINAFAAGTTVENAAIGVTRGCVRHLTRDELQGVIGHEFSHILSGDMKINLRLIGVLAGILVIGHVGSLLLRSSFYASAGSSRRSKDSGGGGLVIAILVLGGSLALIGFVGAFFGSWIKSAVSRQREYLADASAVQFTRSRDGIAGALKKIGGFRRRSLLRTPAADECSHMFFGKGLNTIFATHPPLAKRILALDPSWDGEFARIEDQTPAPAEKQQEPPEKKPPRIAADQFAHAVALSAAALIGQPTNDHLAYAANLYSSIPERLRAMAGDPFSARAIVCAMLISRFKETQRVQLSAVHRLGGAGLVSELRASAAAVVNLDPTLRLPLLELTAPSLKRLSPDQAETFVRLLDELINADQKVDLFEWCVRRLVVAPLQGRRRAATHFYSVNRDIEQEAEKLLGWLAVAGHSGLNDAKQAYAMGAERFGIDARLIPQSDHRPEEIDAALDSLAKTSPKIKKRLIESCATVVSFDKTVTPQEAELFRAIAESLGVPVPPVLPGQALI